jgi:rare lipoprotein A
MVWSDRKSRRALLHPAFALAFAAGALSACALPAPHDQAFPPPEIEVPPTPQPGLEPGVGMPRFEQAGIASWYHETKKMKRTASGERVSSTDLTAAHRTLPINTMVRVTNLNNGLSILVRINDRGPYKPGRVIDLSSRAAKLLGMEHDGIVPVNIKVYDADQPKKRIQSVAAF